ncbi:methyl-accepting chemotaxis protein [Salinivibrio kushneri]|uniref:methyl-accepting chemotaxis protein n=1 Tax=Salinivibrio kushneri TaxID=1908198 RepID=UPI0009895D8C|nr:methyl-accepting chemotaxis protein [Salinivibrio kushneri]
MKKLGFRQSLLMGVLILVSLSLGVVSLFTYLNVYDAFKQDKEKTVREYVEANAGTISSYFDEKESVLLNLSEYYKSNPFPDNKIALVKHIAASTNMDSVVFTSGNGKAYWNQQGADWPGHIYKGDARNREWYKAAVSTNGVATTRAYKGAERMWMSMATQIGNDVLSFDFDLSKMNKIVESFQEMDGAVAVIMDRHSTILASSSPNISNGEQATSLAGFSSVARAVINSTQPKYQEYTYGGVEKVFFSVPLEIADTTWFLGVSVEDEKTFAPIYQTRTTTILMVFAGILAAVAAFYLLINKLYRPITSLRVLAEDLSSGEADLTKRLNLERNDDLGDIGRGIDAFIDKVHRAVADIVEVSLGLSDNVERLQSLTEENAKSMGQHSVETEQVATAIEEMNSTAHSVAQSAVKASQITVDAAELGAQSEEVVRKAQSLNERLLEDMEASVALVNDMNASSDNINDALKVIGEIAEQTNLLALNAAIEAARAGEQGRGFAVVADEVRTLASRTMDSTKEIDKVLSALLASSEQMSAAINRTKEMCVDTASGQEQVATSLRTMAEYAKETDDASTQISTAAEEQSAVSTDISENMNRIKTIVASISKGSDVVTEEAEKIGRLNSRLHETVKRFRV